MQTIKSHIKEGNFSQIYLLYGQEDYLKKMYRDKLRGTMIPLEDTMNYSYFEGKDFDMHGLISIAHTVPFFGERRLIIVENSGCFKNQSELADEIESFPKSTFLVFIEREVDKRNRMYKAVQKLGTITELNGLSEQDLKVWIATILGKENKKITEQDISYMLQKTGADMKNLENELEKIICYLGEENIVNKKVIDEVCVVQTEGKIFQMIDAIGMQQQEIALDLYYDLLALREKPMSILFLLIRHFNILLQVKELERLGVPSGQMASKVGIPPFTVKKYLSQAKNFSMGGLKSILRRSVEVEEGVKTGLLLDQIGVELLIVEFSKKRR
ncbi:MAG: DNA polymerase III subunit delta [Lachnospiraceae bacterium]|nr:DNA polymerase III subunit delta [Lachnospiraceae bacterium]